MITQQGVRALLGFMTARYTRWADGIILGIGDAPATDLDTDLQFPVEIARVDIIVPEQLTQSLIARAPFSANTNSKIYEVGLINDMSTYDIQHIVSFDPQIEEFTGGVEETALGRYGLRSIRVGAAGSVLYEGQNQDFERYSQQAIFSLAVNRIASGNTYIEVRLGQDATNYFTTTAIVNAGTGYVVPTWQKSDFEAVGIPTWSNIARIEFVITGTPDIVLDGFSVRRERINPNILFVARQVLDTPVQKLTTQNMDVEYRIRMNFG